MTPFFTSLPETVWAEVNRRVRAEPAAQALLASAEMTDAFLDLGADLDLWRPGQLGLAALAVLEPKSASDPVQWLKTSGRELLARAYNSLVAPAATAAEAKPLPELVTATLAAVALHQRHLATRDLSSIVADASAAPDRWALPLVCLYGLLDEPAGLVTALLQHAARHTATARSFVELTTRLLVANESLADLPSLARTHLANLPPALCAIFARRAAGLGLPDLARAAAEATPVEPSQPATQPPNPQPDLPYDLPAFFRTLGESLELTFLREFVDPEQAHAQIGNAVEAAQSFAADLALHLGRRSLLNGDPVSAIAAFQEAQSLRPYDKQIHALIAEAAAQRGDERSAQVALGAIAKAKTPPAARLAAGRAHRKLGNAAEARQTARTIIGFGAPAGKSLSDSSDVNEAELDTLIGTAELLTALGDHAAAAAAWGAVAARQPTLAQAHLAHARHALELNQTEPALESAWAAAGLDPANSLARQTLAAALARANDFAAALLQWQRAAELEPTPQVKVRMAEAALAAGKTQLALETANGILTAATHDEASAAIASTGQPHIIAGRALTALDQPDQAFEHFQKAVNLAPHSVESWRAVAAYHKSQNDVPRALATLDAGKNVIDGNSPEAADFYADLGELRAEMHHITEATLAFEKAAELKPTRIDVLKRLGELYRLQNKLSAAVEVTQRAATAAMKDAGLWHLLGQMLEAAGRLPDALAAYRRAQSVGEGFPQLYRDLGRLAYQLHDLPIARSALESVVAGRQSFEPADLDALILLGAIYEQAGEFASALDVYKHAIALDPLRSDLCVRLGICCLQLGQPETAIAAIRDATERDTDNFNLQKVMGDAYAAAHLWTEAMLSYEQAGRLAPDDHALLQTLARTARIAGEPGRAIDVLQKAIALAPDKADYRLDLGDVFVSLGKLPEARATYAEACHLMPEVCALWMGLGQTHLAQHEIKEAAMAFDKAAQLEPDNPNVMMAVGETQWLLGQFEPAHLAFSRAAELEPANPTPLRRAGECMWELGREAMAIALWQKVLVAHPDDSPTHARLGFALARQGRFADALSALERAVQASPADPRLAAEAARVSLDAGDSIRATHYLEQAAKIKPDDASVWQLLARAFHARGALDRALASIHRALRLAPKDAPSQATLARLLLESGKPAEAVTAAEAALKSEGADLNVLGTVAEVFTAAGRFGDAVEAAASVAEGRPNDPAAHLAFARALVLNAESAQMTITDSQFEAMTRALDRAAALGANTDEVREWTGRARALNRQLEEALPLLEAAAAARPSADLLRILASAYRQLGQPQPARTAILAALDRAPDSIPALLELGLVCLAQDDKTAARAAFRRAIELDMHCARAYQLLADTVVGLGERTEAIALYNQALTLDPAQAAWHHRLAELYDAVRDTSAALAHYQRAATLALEQKYPARESANYLAALARASARDRDLNSAREYLEAALKLRDDVTTWWAQCGHINFELKYYERAFECFSVAADRQPADIAANMGAARAALALGREAEAEAKATAVLRQNPDSYDALIVIAEVYERRGDYNNALVAYTNASVNTPNPLPALLAQARLLRELKRPADAAAVLARIVELAPEDDTAHALLGQTLHEAGKNDEALVHLQRAAQIAPRNPAHVIGLARFYRLTGQLDAALGHLQTARELDPDSVEALREMAQVFEARRQYNRAYEVYQMLMELEPTNADHFFRAGLALKAARDYMEALTLFEKAIKLDPDNTEAQHQRTTVAAIGILRGKS